MPAQESCIWFSVALHSLRSPIWSNTGSSLTFHIPGTDTKGTVQVCLVLDDGSCHGNAAVTYQSAPSCEGIKPNSSWFR